MTDDEKHVNFCTRGTAYPGVYFFCDARDTDEPRCAYFVFGGELCGLKTARNHCLSERAMKDALALEEMEQL